MRCCRRIALSASGFLPPDRNASNFNCRYEWARPRNLESPFTYFCAQECGKTWFRVPSFTRIARRRCSLALPKLPPTPRSRGAIKSLIQFIAPPPPHISEFMIKSGEGGWECMRAKVEVEALLCWSRRDILVSFWKVWNSIRLEEFGKNANLIMKHFRVSILNYSHSFRGKGSRRNCRSDIF